MIDSPLISVITPTYNRAHTLARAVTSVLNQTYRNFEYIIVDDGSRDNTTQLVDKLIAEDREKKIRYYKREKNGGQNAALNSGLDLARGELIAFLDSDDEWLPTMLEKQARKFVENKDISCSYTWSGRRLNGEIETIREYTLEGSIYKEALEQGYVSGPITLMVKKECFDVIGGFNNEFTVCQDDDLCFQLAKRYQFGLVKEPLAVIYEDAGNQTIKNAEAYAEGWTKLFSKYEKDILSYCGPDTLSKHYLKCSKLYLKSRNTEKMRSMAKRSLKNSFSVSASILVVFPASLLAWIVKIVKPHFFS